MQHFNPRVAGFTTFVEIMQRSRPISRVFHMHLHNRLIGRLRKPTIAMLECRHVVSVLVVILVWSPATLGEEGARSGSQAVSFRQSVAAVLLAKCHGCHNEEASEGGYSVENFGELLKRGDSGETPVVPGDPAASELYRRLVSAEEDVRMPADGDPLPEDRIRLLRRWIEQGAVYDADDRDASLASILPVARHPDPPERYAFPIPLTALAFHDGDLLVGGYHEVIRWNLENHAIVKRYQQVGERTLAILPVDSESVPVGVLVVGGGSPGSLGEVRVLDAVSGGLVAVPLTTTDVVLDLALRPDGYELAVGAADNRIHRIDLSTMENSQVIGSHSDWVRGVAWNEDGSLLASASRDKTAKVFDASSGRPIATYARHGEDVVDVCFAADGKLISCDANGKVHAWRPTEDKTLHRLKSDIKRAFAIVPAAQSVWLAAHGQVLRLKQKDLGEVMSPGCKSCDADVLSLAISPDGSRLATGDARGRVRIWNCETGALESEFVALPMR